eukprot:g2222.t1
MAAEVEGVALSHTHDQLRRQTVKHRVGNRDGLDGPEDIDMGNARDVAIDFMAGVVSGISGIVVGQPFDTIKVRLQTQDLPSSSSAAAAAGNNPPKVKGAMACAVETVSKEGVLALFKGMGTPLASAALVNAICFGAYAQSQRTLAAYGFVEDRPPDDPHKQGQPCDGWGGDSGRAEGAAAALEREKSLESDRSSNGLVWSFVGGSFAGLCQAAVIIPTDTIKIKLQIQVGARGSSGLQYRGPVDCAMKLVKAEGIGALFRGASVTAIRDTPSMGIYFASYEGFKERLMMAPASVTGGAASAGRWGGGMGLGEQASSFWAGGLAGALSWFVIYPLDVVKSIQQASVDPLDPSTRSMAACFRHVYRQAGGGVPGVRRFFRGVGTTLVRAFPVNAAIFPTFEWTVKVLNQAFPPK